MPDFLTIKKSWEFELIFRTGIRANGELVRLLYLRDDHDNSIKLGLAVGKRLGKSHVRNRGKRILREAFRHIEQRITPGVKIILGLREKGINAKTQDISNELENLFRRKKLLII